MSESERKIYLSQSARADLEKMLDDLPEEEFQEMLHDTEDTFSDKGSFFVYSENEAHDLLQSALGLKIVDLQADPPENMKFSEEEIEGVTEELKRAGTSEKEISGIILSASEDSYLQISGVKFENNVAVGLESAKWSNIGEVDQFDKDGLMNLLSSSTLSRYELSHRRLNLTFRGDEERSLEGNVFLITRLEN